MSADLGIATRLRAAGLDVREVAGWKTRGRDFAGTSPTFDPIGGVNHHTAMPSSVAGDIPSLNVLIHGRSDLVGPLCNVSLSRSGIFYVVAAGVANHAGLPDGGVCRGMHGNSQAYGLEVEHDGLHPLEKARVALLATGWAAILRGRKIAASQLVQHREWAPSRKIDLATNMHGAGDPAPSADAFRALVAAELKRLERVSVWVVSFKTSKRDSDGRLIRSTNRTKDPAAWAKSHPGAYQRGGVRFDPVRG